MKQKVELFWNKQLSEHVDRNGDVWVKNDFDEELCDWGEWVQIGRFQQQTTCAKCGEVKRRMNHE